MRVYWVILDGTIDRLAIATEHLPIAAYHNMIYSLRGICSPRVASIDSNSVAWIVGVLPTSPTALLCQPSGIPFWRDVVGIVDPRTEFTDEGGVEAFDCEVVERRFQATSGIKRICPFLWNAEDEPSHEGDQHQVPHHL